MAARTAAAGASKGMVSVVSAGPPATGNDSLKLPPEAADETAMTLSAVPRVKAAPTARSVLSHCIPSSSVPTSVHGLAGVPRPKAAVTDTPGSPRALIAAITAVAGALNAIGAVVTRDAPLGSEIVNVPPVAVVQICRDPAGIVAIEPESPTRPLPSSTGITAVGRATASEPLVESIPVSS